jgi:hypothetical protein
MIWACYFWHAHGGHHATGLLLHSMHGGHHVQESTDTQTCPLLCRICQKVAPSLVRADCSGSAESDTTTTVLDLMPLPDLNLTLRSDAWLRQQPVAEALAAFDNAFVQQLSDKMRQARCGPQN